MQRNQITPQKDGQEGIEPAIPTAEAIPQPAMQLSLSDWICGRRPLQIGFIVLLIVAALVSEFALRPHFEQVETWGSTIEVIDAKKSNVLALTTSSLALSAAITAIPDDAGTPVAEQLSQLAGNLGIVLAVLYLEKYLLTILSFLSFGVLIPIVCVLFAISLGIHGRLSTSRVLRVLGMRVLIVAAITITVVPASVWVTQRVDETYQVSIAQEEAKAKAKAEEKAAKESKSKSEQKQENKSFLDQLVDGAAQLGSALSSGVQSLTDSVITQATNLIEGAIVMIVTSCLIPLLVLAAFLWMGHALLGIDVSAPTSYLVHRFKK
ncbi:hypothetical protein [Collinsella bouchesdurhonensis]|uniref:hypothetical protein n=1 Tax=Collinsella bouchesdurhonensis TaxID=1907654 RepID=UPI003F8A1577